MNSRNGKYALIIATLVPLVFPLAATGEDGLTLKDVMNGLNKNLQETTYGIIMDDYDLVANASQGIAEHPSPSKELLKKIVGHLGEEMPKFKSYDLQVHDAALELNKAAIEQNKEAMLKSNETIIRGCVNCHQSYRNTINELLSK